MRRHRSLLLLVAIPALLLAAQFGQGGGSDPGGGYFVRTSAPQAGERLGRTVAGDVDGDGQQDVAYLLGNRLEVMIDPGLYEALMAPVTNGKDLVTVPATGRDDLLVVDWQGLKRVSWDVDDVVENSHWVIKRRVDADWVGVDLLRTWTAADGSVHVFGRGADQQSITWMTPSGSNWVTQPIFLPTTPGDLLDIAPLDFDGDGQPELAAIYAGGLLVYELGDPTPIEHEAFENVSSVALATVRHPDADPATLDRECVAWVSAVSSGTHFFSLLEPGVLRNGVNLGPAAISVMRSGDVDNDGDDDLICSSTATWDLTWVENTGVGAPQFLASSALARGPEVNGSPAQNVGWPVIADLDGDGDGDVAYPVHDDQPYLWIRKEEAVNQANLRPTLLTEVVDGVAVGATVDENQQLRFDVQVHPSLPGEYLKVVAWTQANPTALMDPIPVFLQRVAVPDKVAAPSLPFSFQVPGGPSSFTSETTPGFDCLVYVLLQMYDGPSASAPPDAVYPGLLVVLHAQGLDNGAGGATPNQGFVVGLESPFAFSVLREGALYLDGPGGDEGGAGGDVPCVPVPPNQPPAGR